MSIFENNFLGAAGEVVSPGQSRVYAFLRDPDEESLRWRQDVVVDGVYTTRYDIAIPFQEVEVSDRVYLIREGLRVYFNFGLDTTLYGADGLGDFRDVTTDTLPAIPRHGPVTFEQRALIFTDESAYWSVVSDVTDWAGLGSGSNPWPKAYGRVVGVGFVENRVVVFFSRLAVEMSPTGVADTPFIFRELPLMEGAKTQDGQTVGDKYRIATSRRGVYYHGQDNRVRFFDGGNVAVVGHDDLILKDRVLLHYSPQLDMLLIANAGEDENQLYFVDAKSHLIIGRKDQVSQTQVPSNYQLIRAICDGWLDGNKGALHVFYGPHEDTLTSTAYVHQVYSFDPEDVQGEDVEYTTGVVSFPEIVRLRYIDVARIDRVLPAPELTLIVSGEALAETTESFTQPQEVGNVFRYWIDRAGQEFQIVLSGDGHNYRSTGTDRITLNIRSLLENR